MSIKTRMAKLERAAGLVGAALDADIQQEIERIARAYPNVPPGGYERAAELSGVSANELERAFADVRAMTDEEILALAYPEGAQVTIRTRDEAAPAAREAGAAGREAIT